jgi:hypothetical protein
MVSVVACLALGLVLVAAGALKLAGGAAARAALATYGLSGRAAYAAWAALIAAEAVLGVAVGAGLGWATRAAAVLAAGGALAQIGALAAGRDGAPCGCFGARGRVGNASVGRAVLLAAALALVPVLPRTEPSSDGWLAIGLALAVAGIVALAVVVLALAREVGMLRLAVPQAGALEVAHEGPEVGGRLGLLEAPLAPGRLGLAVFTSEGCGVCRALGPAISRFGEHPSVVLRTFDEVADADAWAAADVPGSPFAVALDADGTVLAKGTFNTGAQLESVLAAAERRRGMVRA